MALPRRPAWFPDVRGPHLTDRIAFLHVPKCAGLALTGAMRRKYRLDQHFRNRVTSVAAGPSLTAARLLDVDVIAYRKSVLAYLLARDDLLFVTGHVGCSRAIVDRFAGAWHFVTVLRDPVERFVSEYFYNRYKESDHFATRLSLDEYLADDAARLSAGTYLDLFSGLPRSAPADERIADAVENVSQFALVGFVDQLDDFRADFGRRFGAPLAERRTNENPAPEYAALKREAHARRATIESMCESDIAFYRAVRDKAT